jgi:hypothetical protein
LKAKLEAQAAEAKELQLLKEALDAAQRLDEDENVAEIARDQTREWEEIQRKLSKEDDESKERRAKEENKNLASDKARAIETETDGEEKDAASESASDAFTFFGNLFGGTEKALKAPRDTRSTIVIQTAEPQEKPEKDWAATVFDFFGGSKPEEKKEAPSRGTIMIEEEKKRSVFEFFGSTDEVEKEMGPGRGTIRVNEEETPSNFSFFSGSSASKSTDKKVNQADSEKKPSDFFFGGSEEKGREESTDAVSCTLFNSSYCKPLRPEHVLTLVSLSFSIIERRRESQWRLRNRMPPKQANAATWVREQPSPLSVPKKWRKRRRILDMKWQRLPSAVSNKMKVTSRMVLCRRFLEATQRMPRRHQLRHFPPAQLLKKQMRNKVLHLFQCGLRTSTAPLQVLLATLRTSELEPRSPRLLSRKGLKPGQSLQQVREANIGLV